jgi:hypothetical protein
VDGIGALSVRDRRLIVVGQRSRIGDSLNLDAALRKAFPNTHRWDYVFSVIDSGRLLALEPHTARDSEIDTMIAKKRHAMEQLRHNLRPDVAVSQWLWVSHGRPSFLRMERASRRLAQAGIKYLGRSVTSLD